MDGDIRDQYRRGTDGMNRPQPQPSMRRPAPSNPSHNPKPTHQPAANHIPRATPEYEAEPELHHLNKRAEKRQRRKKLAVAAVAALLIIAAGLYLINSMGTKAGNGYFPANITAKQMTIPVYYPVELSSDFKVTGYKMVKNNTLTYTVVSKNNDQFYVTIQSEPSADLLTSFNKNFSSPKTYTTVAGTAQAAINNTGNALLASIRTNKGSWIVITSPAIRSLSDMETITRSLRQVSL